RLPRRRQRLRVEIDGGRFDPDLLLRRERAERIVEKILIKNVVEPAEVRMLALRLRNLCDAIQLRRTERDVTRLGRRDGGFENQQVVVATVLRDRRDGRLHE